MAFPNYFFWSGISLCIFYLFYLLLFRRETFFVLNRVYLLIALGLSVVIPFFDLSGLVALSKTELVVAALSAVGVDQLRNVAGKELDWLSLIYWMGVAINVALLLIKLLGIKKQLRLPANGAAFSFWKTKVVDPSLSGFEAINAHELVHMKQFHTLDILFIEVMGVFFWFNPVIYAYRRSLKLIHEYLADEYAAAFSVSKKQYATLLFFQNFNAGPELGNSFYNKSLLESRIGMLQRKKSARHRLCKYLLCVPVIVLVTFLCAFSKSDFSLSNAEKIDQIAHFSGGFEAFKNYLIKNIQKVSAKKGRVTVSFVVETNGEITNSNIEESLDEAADKEALRVINRSPKWEAALQHGNKVRSAYQINLNF